MKKIFAGKALLTKFAVVLGVALLFFLPLTGSAMDSDLRDIELSGKYVFFSKISSPRRMACVTCHDQPLAGREAFPVLTCIKW